MEPKDNSATASHARLEADLRLMRLGREMRRRVRSRMPLAEVLRELGLRMAADAVLLWLPGAHLKLAVGVRERELPVAIAAEFDAQVAQLGDPAAMGDQPARIIQGEQPPAACRLLVIPADVGSGRIPAWLVFARTITGARFDAFSTVMAQVQVLRLAPRLMREVDHESGHLSRQGLRTVIRRRPVDSGALVLLDIDGLRTLNHTQGIALGDVAIRVLSRLLVPPVLPRNALVARLDGGKLVILLSGRDTDFAVRTTEKLQKLLEDVELKEHPELPKLSFSAGVAAYDMPVEPFERSLLAADHVLRLAKERGRARIETHQSNDASVIRRVDEDFIAADLREALRTGELELYAQPIVPLRPGRHPLGFELLLRLPGEEGVEGSAGRLVAVAQRFQLLSVLDRFVVDRAFAILAPYRAVLAAQRISVSINVSGASLCDAAFTTHFIEQMRVSQLPAGSIVVEITEQVALGDPMRAGDAMRRLRAAGCGIAIDDFGTGANSLAYVHQLPVTRLKIDGSFVRDIITNKRSESAVKGIVQLARDFVLQTVGEHIETPEQADFLRRVGVDFGQGYLYGRAQPLDAVMDALAEQDTATLWALKVPAAS
ncbi:MAG: bifunctional diguanylate cyclase/phosphodiesterase [Pseudomonadota bacterium]|nr:bifunctional diguanylate cyclase/phosphodiesterase [Pseudomonadota bacterium]